MLFKDMGDDELRQAYAGWRQTLCNWSDVAAPRARDRGCSARGTGRALRNVELIEAIALRRNISLRAVDFPAGASRKVVGPML